MNWLHVKLGALLGLVAFLYTFAGLWALGLGWHALAAAVNAFVSVLGWFIAHEIADGCFTTAAGAPWSGIADVLDALPGPALVLIVVLLNPHWR